MKTRVFVIFVLFVSLVLLSSSAMSAQGPTSTPAAKPTSSHPGRVPTPGTRPPRKAPSVGGAIRYNPGFTNNVLPANDDGSTSLVPIGFQLSFFGSTYNSLYVNNNGNVTFDAPQNTYTPYDLTSTTRVIIAPFFADVDTRNSYSGLVTFGTDSVGGHTAFGVNWFNVGYYSYNVDKLDTFQLVLIDRSDLAAGSFDIEFNYGQIQWETGDASSGSGGLGGYSARVGYSNGSGNPGTFYELPGSAIPGSFLDSNFSTGLINNNQNSSIQGRYLFQVRSGLPASSLDLPFPHNSGDTGLNLINSFFDHEYPIYAQEPSSVASTILKYSGERLSGTRTNCVLGVSCYSGHDGYDFGLPNGTAVLAAQSGYGAGTQWFCSGGSTLINVVTITQGNYRTAYLHLQGDSIWQGFVNNPRNVNAGDRIGTVGNSGAPACSSGGHLHFGVYYDVNNDGNFKVVDPYGWQPAQLGQSDPWANYPGGAPSTWLWRFSPPDQENAYPNLETLLTSGSATVDISPSSILNPAVLNLTVVPEPGSATLSLAPQRGAVRSPSSIVTVPTGYTYQLSAVYSNGTALATFAYPVTVTITYVDSNLTYVNTATLGLYQWDPSSSSWILLPTTVNTSAHQATATTNQPGTISLRAQPLNPAPILYAISPSSALNSTDSTIVVTGANFLSTPTLSLGLTTLNVTYVSSSRVEATIPSLMAPGTFVLRLRNPDAQTATVPNGFTVLQATFLPDITR